MYIPSESNIHIDVYDINGRFLQVLEKGNYPAGEYIIKWDASAYPSGIYFIRLFIQNEIHSTKVILMK
jgi:hypothetical protein